MADEKGAEGPHLRTPRRSTPCSRPPGKMAIDSMERHVALANNAMKRLVDPESVEGSIADDAQQALGIVARDAMTAFTSGAASSPWPARTTKQPEE